jgi:hypothetical protein
MNKEERYTEVTMGGVLSGCLSALMFWLILLFLVLLFGSCKTRERIVVVETVRADTLRLSSNIRDSIHLHDSIYIRDKGDTIWIERWHTRWRDRTVHDTTYISKTDSVPVPYPVIQEVPKPLAWWKSLLIRIGAGTVAILLLWLGWKAAKLYFLKI